MRKRTFLGFGAMFLVSQGVAGGVSAEESSEPNWQLTFEDNFDGTELDTDKWRIDIGNGFFDGDEYVEGWGNNEKQSYQEDNVRVEDGRLILEAREEQTSDEHGDYDYTSGKILTDEKFSQAYGRFEASMKLPEGQGFWPAFWMMPQDDVYGGWAASGEIDIMENRGSHTDEVGAAIHYGDLWPNNTYSEQSYDFPEGQSTTDFNEYAVEWEPGEIRWYVNDELYSTKTEWSTKYGEYPAPFDQEFYMILNLAIGGWYGGDPDETTGFPAQVEVEYVRAYEDADAEHPPPGEKIDPEESDEEEDEGPEPVDETKNWEEIGENLIEDGTFDTTTEFGDENGGSTWNVFNLADHDPNGGKADFAIVDGTLQAEVSQSGWNWWQIQLMQDVSASAGTYKLEFDARSDESRTIRTELTGAGYRLVDVDISEEWETHEVLLRAEEPGDFTVLFGLGNDSDDPEPAVPYDIELDNVRLVEVGEDGESSAPADPNESDNWVESGGNLIEDGTFDETAEFGDENGGFTWNVFNMADHDPSGGTADFSVVDGELKASVTQVGWEWFHIQLMQDVAAEAGVYKLEFDMRSEEARNVRAELTGAGAGLKTFDVDEEMSTYSTYLNVENPGDFTLMFGLGRNQSDVEPAVPYDMFIDNMRLVPVVEGEPEEEAEQPEEEQAPVFTPPGNGASFSVDEDGNWSIHTPNGKEVTPGGGKQTPPGHEKGKGKGNGKN
ncbi:glycoside hydrolase family 16 protein [Alkalicoccus urumqiensis]|uniref:GH16 domain-containing protein n=1 Tax=Alkalicoccus urumqiensis TaxID=1548213 RepID=A0A2P6MIG5_ALKUR|nr:glycoside hydrolase family 16 protein [Alkalicoccus urumqiensis]PRO66095.1 hypothetical protein C6I21_07300 [Alkalicoccus urumqiensis]